MKKLMIFVKAPVPGHVKTRLCPPLSLEEAAALYRAFVQDTVERLSGSDWTLEIAYKPIKPLENLSWLDPEIPFFQQEGFDLGARLAHAFEKAFSSGARQVVAIGSDSPELFPSLLEKAFEGLNSTNAVLGPTHDGGYYLIGLSRPCPEIFSGIPWSTAKVYRETLEKISRLRLSWRELPKFRDVDTPEDLKSLRESLRRLPPQELPRTRKAMRATPCPGFP